MRALLSFGLTVVVVGYMFVMPAASQPISLCFSPQQEYAAGFRPYHVSAGDFDGDGDADLAVTNNFNAASSNTFSLLWNDGAGAFPLKTELSAGAQPYGVITEDLDADGDLDLAVTNVYGASVSILLGNGNGTFAAPANYPVGQHPHDLAAGDLNGDGMPDLAVCDGLDDAISVLLNNGDGTFAAQVQYPAGDGAHDICIADINGDSRPDVIVADYNSDFVSLYFNDGLGGFAPAPNYSVGIYPYSLATGDWDQDGDADLAISVIPGGMNGHVAVGMNNGTGTFAAPIEYSVLNSPLSLCSADLDGDGYADLAVAHHDSDSASVLRGNGDGTFAPAISFAVGENSTDILGEDLDLDGDEDLSVTNAGDDNISVLINCSVPTSASFCDGFEDGAAFLSRWNVDRCCVLPAGTAHTGDSALSFGGPPEYCLSWIRRSGFEATTGEYSGWYYQTNYRTGGQLYIQSQDDPDSHPQYRPGYGVSLNAANSEDPTFWLIRADGTCPDGCYNILGALSPQFNLNQWVQIVVRRLSGGTIIAGYDLDGIGALYDSLVFVDSDPLLSPGRFYVTGCGGVGAGDERRNFWDDVCYLMDNQALNVAVDIKPTSCPNPFELRADGTVDGERDDLDMNRAHSAAAYNNTKAVLPVAVLGSADFDVTTVDPTTVSLNGVPALRWAVEDVAAPVGEDAEGCECTIAGPDEYADLTLKFNRAEIAATLGAVIDGDFIALTLTGNLTDGTPVEGSDCIWIRLKGKGGSTSFGDPPTVESHPNPFNASTTIRYTLNEPGDVNLSIFNVLGQRVATLVDGHQSAGDHGVPWAASDVPSGMYFYRLQANGIVLTRKMTLLK